MRSFAKLLGLIAVFGAFVVTAVTFTLSMLATGNIVLLLIGWFAIPITVLVWPAMAGALWIPVYYVALVLGMAFFAWGTSEQELEQMRRQRY